MPRIHLLVLLLGLAGASAHAADKPALIKRGGYLATTMGCHDCHTPMKMGPKGPEPDFTRMLSGHPEGLKMPPAPAAGPMPWAWTGSATMTAFAGPWGVTYSANLTPDKETGLGMTEAQFIQALRTGKHLGQGRPILPPMPWPNLAKATDADLKTLYAFLQSIPAIKNRVPEPEPPAAAPAH